MKHVFTVGITDHRSSISREINAMQECLEIDITITTNVQE